MNNSFKKIRYVSLVVFLITLFLVPQEIQHDSTVVNIEVPVRVYSKGVFVENLNLEDFEIFEDGRPQTLESVYLIRKTNVAREEGNPNLRPTISRQFVLLFALQEYLPRVGDALKYFFSQVLTPADTLQVVTPAKTYNLKPESYQRLPKEKIADQIRRKLRADIQLGNSEYRSAIRHLEDIMRFDVDPEVKQIMYMDQVRIFKDLKYMDRERLLSFADYLKGREGQKIVFLFYQKELIPVLPGLDEFSQMELIKEVNFDTDEILKAYSDASISIHFLFVTNKGMREDIDVRGMAPLRVDLLDMSDRIFAAFKTVARATGGVAESSQNAAAAFRTAADATENYYLVYYRPADYRADGKFRKIEVKVKGRRYRVLHRAGYIAD